MLPFLSRFLAKVHPRTEIPMIATVISGVLAAILAFIFNLHDLVEMMSIGTLLAYTIVALCVLILRYQPETIGLVKAKNEEACLNTHISNAEDDDSPLLMVEQARQPSQRTALLALAAMVTSCIGFVGLSAFVIWGFPGLSQAKWWAITAMILIALVLIGSILLLLWLPQNKTPLSFKVPCVPILPLFSVFINVFLILKLSYLTWIRFAAWMSIGEFEYRSILVTSQQIIILSHHS